MSQAERQVNLARLELVLLYLVRQVASEGRPVWVASLPPKSG